MSIQPPHEDLRKATRWISEQRRENPGKRLVDLVAEASFKFDLSPLDGEFLFRLVTRDDPPAET